MNRNIIQRVSHSHPHQGHQHNLIGPYSLKTRLVIWVKLGITVSLRVLHLRVINQCLICGSPTYHWLPIHGFRAWRCFIPFPAFSSPKKYSLKTKSCFLIKKNPYFIFLKLIPVYEISFSL